MLVSKFYEKSLAQMKQNLLSDLYLMMRVKGMCNKEVTMNDNYVSIEHEHLGWLPINENHPVDMIGVENSGTAFWLTVRIGGVKYNIHELDNMFIISHILERHFKVTD